MGLTSQTRVTAWNRFAWANLNKVYALRASIAERGRGVERKSFEPTS